MLSSLRKANEEMQLKLQAYIQREQALEEQEARFSEIQNELASTRKQAAVLEVKEQEILEMTDSLAKERDGVKRLEESVSQKQKTIDELLASGDSSARTRDAVATSNHEQLQRELEQTRQELAQSKASAQALTQQVHEHHSRSLLLAASVANLTQTHGDQARKWKARLAWLDAQRRAKLTQKSSIAMLKERVSQGKRIEPAGSQAASEFEKDAQRVAMSGLCLGLVLLIASLLNVLGLTSHEWVSGKLRTVQLGDFDDIGVADDTLIPETGTYFQGLWATCATYDEPDLVVEVESPVEGASYLRQFPIDRLGGCTDHQRTSGWLQFVRAFAMLSYLLSLPALFFSLVAVISPAAFQSFVKPVGLSLTGSILFGVIATAVFVSKNDEIFTEQPNNVLYPIDDTNVRFAWGFSLFIVSWALAVFAYVPLGVASKVLKLEADEAEDSEYYGDAESGKERK